MDRERRNEKINQVEYYLFPVVIVTSSSILSITSMPFKNQEKNGVGFASLSLHLKVTDSPATA